VRFWRPRSVLPVLAKELAEQAARRRTYVLRIVYALAFYVIFCIFLYGTVSWAQNDPVRLLGHGRTMFDFIVGLQFVGIAVMLPGMMSGVLTSEKERDSLALVLVTALSPWEIVLQKYLGRLVPMFTFLLLSLPLLAVSYAFGGITGDYLASGVFALALFALQVGAIALVVSAYCRTSTAAFIGSYVAGLVFFLGPVISAVILEAFDVSNVGRGLFDEDVVLAFWPIYVFFEGSWRHWSFGESVARHIPSMVSVLAFIVLARVFVVRRAFAKPKHRLIRTFRAMDRFWHEANQSIGGVVLARGASALPEDAPIAWRETAKKALGSFSHLVRLGLLLNVPLVFLALLLIFGDASNEPIAVLMFFVLALAVVSVAVKGAGAVSGERTARTLDVLLAAPMTGAEIVRQKMKGAGRLCAFFLFSMAMLIAVYVWLGRSSYTGYRYAGYSYTPWTTETLSGFTWALASLIYLPMFAWLGFWIGMKTRSRARAVSATTVAIVLWIVVPIALFVLADVVAEEFLWHYHPERSDSYVGYLLVLSPASVLILAEEPMFFGYHSSWYHTDWGMLLVNCILYGGILVALRHRCMRKADRYLGRIEERPTRAPALRPAPGVT
jgi:ABC-type transport system involved in multi-copper enzyme maturation permease subunit